ncbi:MAG: hypothetical protein ACM3MF_06070 [Anaerolineae bacterium]
MTWENFYLLCFLIGLGMSALSFLLGSFNIHLPHVHLNGVQGGHYVHLDVGHVHGEVGSGGAAANGEANGGAARGGYGIAPINFSTLMAFLAWFGGAGYLLTHYSKASGLVALMFSGIVGLFGGALVFWFMAKVLYSVEEELDPADYEMVGTLGRLTVGIREGGTGEIVYTQGGSRKSVAARSESGAAIEKGSEVVVTRYEKGIAYVRRWEELAGDSASAAGGAGIN